MSLDRDQEMDEARIEQALRNFRGSIKAWSDEEFAKPRAVRHSRWTAMWMTLTRPAVSGAMAAVLAAASIGVPVAVVHHQREVAERVQAEANRQKIIEAQQASEHAAQAMNDADLMTEVDSDIAQEAPDAMQPLASLMSSDSGSTAVEK